MEINERCNVVFVFVHFIQISSSVLMLWFMIQQVVHDLGVQYESVIYMFPVCEFVLRVSASLNIIDVDVKRVSSSPAITSCVFCASQFTHPFMKFTCKACCHFCYLIMYDIWLQHTTIYLYPTEYSF